MEYEGLANLAEQLTELKSVPVRLKGNISFHMPYVQHIFRETPKGESFQELFRFNGYIQIERGESSGIKISYSNGHMLGMFAGAVKPWRVKYDQEKPNDGRVITEVNDIKIPDFIHIYQYSKLIIKPDYQIDLGQYGLRHLKNVYSKDRVEGLEEEGLSDTQIIEFFKSQNETTENITKYLIESRWLAHRVIDSQLSWGLPKEEVLASIEKHIES